MVMTNVATFDLCRLALGVCSNCESSAAIVTMAVGVGVRSKRVANATSVRRGRVSAPALSFCPTHPPGLNTSIAVVEKIGVLDRHNKIVATVTLTHLDATGTSRPHPPDHARG